MSFSYEPKALEFYGEVCVNKGLVRQAGLGVRAIPAYVSEWIISRNASDGQLDEASRQRIQDFINRYLPAKDQKIGRAHV